MPDGLYSFEDAQDDDGTLDEEAVSLIRNGSSGLPDPEAAERLLDQIAATMVNVSTGGPRIDDVAAAYTREYRALSAVLRRLEIENTNRYSDLWQWHARWSDGTLPTYRSRRSFIAEMYAPVRSALEKASEFHREVAAGSEDGPTGWPDVDAKLGTLRRRVRESDDSSDDARAVGLQCVAVLEALGRAAFDPNIHLPAEEELPHANDAKARLGHFLNAVAGGDRFEHVRSLVRASWRQAQAVKHRDEPNRTDAGIAADSVVLLVAMIRRIADEEQPAAPASAGS